MLFGNRGMEDILMKKELKKAEKKSKGRFKVVLIKFIEHKYDM